MLFVYVHELCGKGSLTVSANDLSHVVRISMGKQN